MWTVNENVGNHQVEDTASKDKQILRKEMFGTKKGELRVGLLGKEFNRQISLLYKLDFF